MSFPPGLSMSAAGVISGTPTTAGTFTFPVTVTDANGATATAQLTIVVAPALVITVSGVPGAVIGQPFTFALTATGGQPPLVWVQQ